VSPGDVPSGVIDPLIGELLRYGILGLGWIIAAGLFYLYHRERNDRLDDHRRFYEETNRITRDVVETQQTSATATEKLTGIIQGLSGRIG